MAGPSVWTREELEIHLKGAVELELTTIPPYLTALYSLKPKTNEKARALIRSVVIEEMLHLALAANVLNAIGGSPEIAGQFTPSYPAKLPFHTPSSFAVGLAPFSAEALDTFMAIENPNHPETANVAAAAPEAVPTRVFLLAQQYEYKTIGEFYGAVEEGLRALDDGSLFVGK
jgi:Ferritin-like